MGAEGDGIDGDLSWNGVAFETSELFRFCHDVLDMQPKTKLSSEFVDRRNSARGGKRRRREENISISSTYIQEVGAAVDR